MGLTIINLDHLKTPEGYSVVYADPAWEFKTYSIKGQGKSPQKHYPCMKTKDIAAMPVQDLLAKDCALFMWCTWPMIFDAKEVLEGWGFKYSGLAWEWIKKNPKTGKYAFGGGYGTRKNLEPCILARRGKPQLKLRNVRDFLYAPRREHSRKPDEAYTLIESMYDGPYLELFGRNQRPDWTTWGNETTKFPEVPNVLQSSSTP